MGPLDLLLHLCRTEEMDLTRVPVRTITDQYLTHLESVRFQDLETAGAFMVMAATLIYLKSKLLLPASPDDPAEALDEEGELLRQELAERLREYARVKAFGAWLGEREAEQARLSTAACRASCRRPRTCRSRISPCTCSSARCNASSRSRSARRPRQVEPNPLSVLERMGEILDLLRNTWSSSSPRWRARRSIRAEWVVTLLALLELVRLGQARARQAELFGEIAIERHSVERAGARRSPPSTTTAHDERTTRSGVHDRAHRRARSPALRLGHARRGRRASRRCSTCRPRTPRASWSRTSAAGFDEQGRRAADHRGGRGLPPRDAPGGRAVARQARAEQDPSRLSRPALETLAIIAYRQPVSRPEVDAVRGVNSEARARQPARAPA